MVKRDTPPPPRPQHTPGPWEVTTVGTRYAYIYRIQTADARHDYVAEVVKDQQDREADARLLAAAPALKALLERMLGHFCHSDVPAPDDDGGAGWLAWQMEADAIEEEAGLLLEQIAQGEEGEL